MDLPNPASSSECVSFSLFLPSTTEPLPVNRSEKKKGAREPD